MSTWDLTKTKQHFFICNGGSCLKNGAEEVTQAIRSEISYQGLDDYLHTTRTKCNGRCADACIVIAYPDGVWYKDIIPEDANSLINHHYRLDQPYLEKVLYSYQKNTFVAKEGVRKGILRSEL